MLGNVWCACIANFSINPALYLKLRKEISFQNALLPPKLRYHIPWKLMVGSDASFPCDIWSFLRERKFVHVPGCNPTIIITMTWRGLGHWETLWSPKKKDWCCKHLGGCHAPWTKIQRFDATKFEDEMSRWNDSHDIVRICSGAKKLILFLRIRKNLWN